MKADLITIEQQGLDPHTKGGFVECGIGEGISQGTSNRADAVEPTHQPGADEIGVSVAPADRAAPIATTNPEAPVVDAANFLTDLRAKHSQAKPLHDLAKGTPAIEPEQFWEMVEDIRQNGQVVPIITVQGKVLDGVIREIACFETGVQPHYQEWQGDLQPRKLKASLDIFRRHLTASQRAALVTDLLLAEENHPAHTKFANVRKTRNLTKRKKELANAAGISSRIVDDGMKLAKHAPKELEKVRAGKKKVSKAVAEVNLAGDVKAMPSDSKDFVCEQQPASVTEDAASEPLAKSPSEQLLLSWPDLKDLLQTAKKLVETSGEQLRSRRMTCNPRTEEFVMDDNPRYRLDVAGSPGGDQAGESVHHCSRRNRSQVDGSAEGSR